MMLTFHTPQGEAKIDPATATDAEWAALNISPESRDKYRHDAQVAQEFNDIHTQARLLYYNWATATPAQKDAVLKNLLGYCLWQEGYL